MAVFKKRNVDNVGHQEGILLSLIYLGNELELAHMHTTKEKLNDVLVSAIKEIFQHEICEEDATAIAMFVKKAFYQNKENLDDIVKTISSFEGR